MPIFAPDAQQVRIIALLDHDQIVAYSDNPP